MKMAERNELAMVFTREFITNEGPVTLLVCLTVLLVPAMLLIAFLLLSEMLCFEQHMVTLIRA